MHMLPAFLLESPPPEEVPAYLLDLPTSTRLFLYLYVPSFLFAPVFLWSFARECPRVQYRARLDDVSRRMVRASVAIGFAIWVGCGVTSLAVVLYEMVSRDHPFARPGADAGEVADRRRRRRVGADGVQPSPPRRSAVAAFAMSVLSAPRPVRPPTAQRFAEALRGAVAEDL